MATREAAKLGSRKRARRHAEPTTCPLSSIPSTPSPTHVARVGPPRSESERSILRRCGGW
jgi:hypothetical protein